MSASEVRRNIVIQSDSHAVHQNDSLEQISSIAQEVIIETNSERDEVLETYLDPITFHLMQDPVVTSSGRSYERSTIYNIIYNGDGLDPFTREPLGPMLRNRNLKNAIEQWKKSSSYTQERLNQIIGHVREGKRKEKEKTDAINKFHDELFAPIDDEKTDSCQKEEIRRLRMENMRLNQQLQEFAVSQRVSSSLISPAIVPRIAFRKVDWERYIGNIGIESPLPSNIEEILLSPCPFFGGQKLVGDTHMLVFFPCKVNGKPLTLNYLGELIRRPKGGGFATKFRHYACAKSLGEKTISQSYWALMTKDLVPGSRRKNYKEQCAIIAKYRNYHLPSILEGAVSILMHYVKCGGERLYSNNPWTYTFCQEQITIGGFAPDGFAIGGGSRNSSGVAGFRRF